MSSPEEAGYLISISACEIDPTRLALTIETNLPTPVEVVAGVNLVNIGPREIYVGHAEQIRLESPQTVHILDLARLDPPLPAGAYEARVAFFKRWGAVGGNSAAQAAPDIWAADAIELTGTQVSPP